MCGVTTFLMYNGTSRSLTGVSDDAIDFLDFTFIFKLKFILICRNDTMFPVKSKVIISVTTNVLIETVFLGQGQRRIQT